MTASIRQGTDARAGAAAGCFSLAQPARDGAAGGQALRGQPGPNPSLLFSGWRLAAKPGGEAWRRSLAAERLPASRLHKLFSLTHTRTHRRTHAQTLTHSLTHTRTQVLDRLRGLLQSAVAADVEKGVGGDAGADVLCVVYTGCAQKHSGR